MLASCETGTIREVSQQEVRFRLLLSICRGLHPSARSGGETNASQLGRHSETVIEIKARSINCISRPLRPYQKKNRAWGPSAAQLVIPGDDKDEPRRGNKEDDLVGIWDREAEPPGQLSTLQHQYVCVI